MSVKKKWQAAFFISAASSQEDFSSKFTKKVLIKKKGQATFYISAASSQEDFSSKFTKRY